MLCHVWRAPLWLISDLPTVIYWDSSSCLLLACQVLNFSIAYGKTAHGLSRDWGTSLEEARDTVERWYSDRPEARALTLGTWYFDSAYFACLCDALVGFSVLDVAALLWYALCVGWMMC